MESQSVIGVCVCLCEWREMGVLGLVVFVRAIVRMRMCESVRTKIHIALHSLQRFDRARAAT